VLTERAEGAAPCGFCRLAQSGPPSLENLVVWRGEWSLVVVNAYPFGSGHVVVVPVRHVGSLVEMNEPEATEIWEVTRQAVSAIEMAYEPDGLNMGANLAAGAGVPDHVHLQVLPRWSGDTGFMTSVAGTRVIPETLQATWHTLRAAWPDA
jgi:diadenosine tetraphosphate (Ap4A) HIT family hydrolase